MKKQVKRFVHLLLYLIFVATTMLGLAGPASAGTVALNTLTAGNTVTFAGYTWMVLNPSMGYLLMQGAYGGEARTVSHGAESDLVMGHNETYGAG